MDQDKSEAEFKVKIEETKKIIELTNKEKAAKIKQEKDQA